MSALYDLIQRQVDFSLRTFGPGERRAGIIAHIHKELVEIAEADQPSREWVDVYLLALDGLWRALIAEGVSPQFIAIAAAGEIVDKLEINRGRTWPDWRKVREDQPIEHVRD